MSKKCLWYFIPNDKEILPFPLFWNGSPPLKDNYEQQPECIKLVLDYIFSDQEIVYKGLSPKDGIIDFWCGLNSLVIL
jgi:hypothetical protein